MRSHQYLTIIAFLFSFTNCFPQNVNPSRRSNAYLASTPEDPENIAVLARTITIGDNTVTVGNFTVGKPRDAGAATAFATETADLRTLETTTGPTATATEPSKSHKATGTCIYPVVCHRSSILLNGDS